MTPDYLIDATDPDDVLVVRVPRTPWGMHLDELLDDPDVLDVVVDRIMDEMEER